MHLIGGKGIQNKVNTLWKDFKRHFLSKERFDVFHPLLLLVHTYR